MAEIWPDSFSTEFKEWDFGPELLAGAAISNEASLEGHVERSDAWITSTISPDKSRERNGLKPPAIFERNNAADR